MKYGWLLGVAIWSASTAGSAKAEGLIGKTYSAAVQSYSDCATLFDVANEISGTYGSTSPIAKEATVAATRCRDKELERTKEAMIPLRAAANGNPKAVDATREFHTYWQSALRQTPPPGKTDKFTNEFRLRLEKLRTELELDW